MMPSLFVSHGSPTLLIEEDSPGRKFLSNLGNHLEKPTAILSISAHWMTKTPKVTSNQQPKTIHDFYGFPPALYEKSYDAEGAPDLAQDVATLVGADLDDSWGLDHGTWVPLSFAYPDADIPVIQLSIQPEQDAQHHYDMGKKLESLRKKGVLIMASGGVTHNLRDIVRFDNDPDQWALDYENWYVECLKNNDHDSLLKADTLAPHFAHAHPSDEHWLPLYVALGAARNTATLLHRGFEHKNLSMATARFD